MESKHAIIIIKNKNGEYLQYYDSRWDCYLFPNCKIDDNLNIKNVEENISGLNVNVIDISLKMDKVHTKFSQSAKVNKEYHHYFYLVKVDDEKNIMINKEFMINGINYKWFYYKKLLDDKRIREVNSDIIEFVKEIENM